MWAWSLFSLSTFYSLNPNSNDINDNLHYSHEVSIKKRLLIDASSCLRIDQMGRSRNYPYPTTDGFHVLTPPCLRNALPPPPCPQNSIIMNPPPLQNFRFFLEVHFRLGNAYMNKRTWIYASSRLRSRGARWQALLFSDKKNLPLVARLCKLLFKSEFGYKNKHHLR